MSTIDLYAVLGIARDASSADIKAAWRRAVADLDPTDPKLNVFNQAGAVLLDDRRRAAYDAELALAEAGAGDGVAGEAARASGETRPRDTPTPLRGSTRPASPVRPADLAARGPESPAAPARNPSVLLLAIMSVLTVAALLVALFAAGWLGPKLPDRGVPAEQERLADAVAAAEKAAVPVLSYDYRHLKQDKAAATKVLTKGFAKDYASTFALIEQSAPEKEAVVTVKVLGSAVAASDADSVDVLLFVNRPTQRKGATEAEVYRDQATFAMREVDGKWLVDDLRTRRPT